MSTNGLDVRGEPKMAVCLKGLPSLCQSSIVQHQNFFIGVVQSSALHLLQRCTAVGDLMQQLCLIKCCAIG